MFAIMQFYKICNIIKMMVKAALVVVGSLFLLLVSCAQKTQSPQIPQIPQKVIDERLSEVRVGMWNIKGGEKR